MSAPLKRRVRRAKDILDGLQQTYDGYAAAEKKRQSLRDQLEAMAADAPGRDAVFNELVKASDEIRDAAFRMVGAVEFFLGVV